MSSSLSLQCFEYVSQLCEGISSLSRNTIRESMRTRDSIKSRARSNQVQSRVDRKGGLCSREVKPARTTGSLCMKRCCSSFSRERRGTGGSLMQRKRNRGREIQNDVGEALSFNLSTTSTYEYITWIYYWETRSRNSVGEDESLKSKIFNPV